MKCANELSALQFQSPRNRVNTSNRETEGATTVESTEFQSPRNRVNTSNIYNEALHRNMTS